MTTGFRAAQFGKSDFDLDGIEMEILWNRLTAITDEMSATLVRTSYSALVREGNDSSCVIMDATGRGLAHSTRGVPSFSLLLPKTTKAMLQVFPPADWAPGDVVITNDPWLANGHLPDLTMVVPIFVSRKLVGFAGTVAHLPDIGGRQLSGAATEIYEEGLQLPIVRLYREYELDQTLWHVLGVNVRVKAHVFGDINAQRATNLLGAQRLEDLILDLQVTDLARMADQIHARSEAVFRDAVASIPDGVYFGEVDGDGLGQPVHLEANLRVRDTSIDVDFEGTSPQSNRGNNVPLSYTAAYTHYALKCILDPLTPTNEGCFVPVTVSAPPRSILNADRPAAVASRHTVGHLIPSVVFAAMAPLLPDAVPAESGTPLWAVCISGEKNGRAFSIFPSFNGGQGAFRNRDGLPCLSFPANAANMPIEVIESLSTMRVVEKRLLRNSGGVGAHAGGPGQRVVLRATGETPVKVTMFTDKIATRAFGLDGGGHGKPGSVLVNGVPVQSPEAELQLHKDDCLELVLPGGGGYGERGSNRD